MPLTDYLTGLAFFAGTAGAVGVAAWIVTDRALRHLGGAALILAFSLLFLSGILLAHVAAGALGLLTRGWVLVASALLALAALAVPRAAATGREPPIESLATDGAASKLVAAIAAGAALVATLAYLSTVVTVASPFSDVTNFTLPNVARWIQGETLWQQNEFVPLFPVGTYPNNGDVIFLAVALPWRNDAFVRLVELPLLAMVAVATYAIARELRAPRAAAIVFATLLVSTRSVASPALEALKPDTFMLATFAAGTLFLLRHARTGRRSDLVLAGIGLGLAFGARWYGVTGVAVVLAVWAAGWLFARRPVMVILRNGLVIGTVVVACGSFWFLRNAVETGNPVFPVRVDLFGLTLLDAPPDLITERYGVTIADHLDDVDVWRESILPDLRARVGAPGLLGLLALLAVGGALVVARARGRGPPAFSPRLAATCVVAALLIAVYVNLPGSAQGTERVPFPGIVGQNARWVMPALVLAVVAGAWLAGRLGRARLALEALALVAIGAGLMQSFPAPFSRLAATAALLGALALVVAAARPHLRGRTRAALVAAVAAVAVVAGGQAIQERFNDSRYLGFDATADWIVLNATEGHRVGFAGAWPGGFTPTMAAFGPRLGNEVAYVGDLSTDFLRQYRRRAPFVDALSRGGFDLLVVGRGTPPLSEVIEERWARSVGFVQVARSPQFTLMGHPELG